MRQPPHGGGEISSTKDAPARSSAPARRAPGRLDRRSLRRRSWHPAARVAARGARRDRGGAAAPSAPRGRRRPAGARSRGGREPAPRDLAREAQLVEPAAARSRRRAPAGCRAPSRPRRPRSPAAARSRAQAVAAVQLGRGRACCQPSRKRMSIRGRRPARSRRRSPSSVQPVDARQQPPLAPLGLLARDRRGGEAPAERRRPRPRGAASARDRPRPAGRRARRERRGGRRADRTRAAPRTMLDQRARRGRPTPRRPRRRLDQVGLDASRRPDRGGQGRRSAGDPERAVAVGRMPRRAPGRDQLVELAASSAPPSSRSGSATRSSSRSCSSSASRTSGQRLVHAPRSIAAGSRRADVVGHGRRRARGGA